ncbi:MAG: hypothetical protein GY937_23965 [bacterium]|nr:hypothetical protein [bacterium]
MVRIKPKRRKLERTVIETYYEHECRQCKTWFEPSRTDEAYCSVQCQQAHAYERRKKAGKLRTR